jgi:hypothetical protein
MTKGCGISHKNTKHTHKYSKTNTQINISIIKISPIIKVSHKYTSVMLNPQFYFFTVYKKTLKDAIKQSMHYS